MKGVDHSGLRCICFRLDEMAGLWLPEDEGERGNWEGCELGTGFFQVDENFLKLDGSGGSATLKKDHPHLRERISQYVHDPQISLTKRRIWRWTQVMVE